MVADSRLTLCRRLSTPLRLHAAAREIRMNKTFRRRFLIAATATAILGVGMGAASAKAVLQRQTPEAISVLQNGPGIVVPAESPSGGQLGDQIEQAPSPAPDGTEEPATHVEVPRPTG